MEQERKVELVEQKIVSLGQVEQKRANLKRAAKKTPQTAKRLKGLNRVPHQLFNGVVLFTVTRVDPSEKVPSWFVVQTDATKESTDDISKCFDTCLKPIKGRSKTFSNPTGMDAFQLFMAVEELLPEFPLEVDSYKVLTVQLLDARQHELTRNDYWLVWRRCGSVYKGFTKADLIADERPNSAHRKLLNKMLAINKRL